MLRGLCGPGRPAQQPEDDRDRGRCARKACRIACSTETEKLKEQLADADKTTVSRREAIEKLKADLKQLEESSKRLDAGTPAPGKPGNRVKGFVGTRRPAVPERAQARRRAHRDPGRRVGEHARRDRRQRDPAAQHAGVAAPAVGEVAPHRRDGRLAHRADSGEIEVPGHRVQRQGVAARAGQRRATGSTAAMRRR